MRLRINLLISFLCICRHSAKLLVSKVSIRWLPKFTASIIGLYTVVCPSIIVSAKTSDLRSIDRFQNAYTELISLDKNWDKIVKDGDSVRRRLGTVYSPPKCESPLCSFAAFTTKFVQNNYGKKFIVSLTIINVRTSFLSTIM